MVTENNFIKGRYKDSYYKFGPKIDNKCYNHNETISLIITEFLSPSLFFAFENSDDCNNNLDNQINIFYNSFDEYFVFDDVPKAGTICVAKFVSDNKWYRAKITSSNFQTKLVDLCFIDYGNIDRNVSLKNIRKLEGSFSTQCKSNVNDERLKSQVCLFGFVGFKPTFPTCAGDILKLSGLILKNIFQFQVVSVPSIKSKSDNGEKTIIPLYLIKNDPFSKSTAKFSNSLIKELNWEESELNESMGVIMNSLLNINYDLLRNVEIIIPIDLKKYHHIDFWNQQTKTQIVTQPKKDVIEIEDKDDDLPSISDRSVKDLSEDETSKDVFDVLKQLEETSLDNPELVNLEDETDKLTNEETSDINETLCSVVNWKMANILVQSHIKRLEWHLPLPDETVFRAIVTSVNDNFGFHINVCSEDIVKSFKCLEKCLDQHFMLCMNSMLKQFVAEDDLVAGSVCLCANNSTYNRALIIGEQTFDSKFKCKLIDYGCEINVEKGDVIPISNQFCGLPPLAVECILSGFGNCENKEMLVKKFEQILEDCEYAVLVSVCLMDKRKTFSRLDDKIIIDQPIPVEIFITRCGDNAETDTFSVNTLLHELAQENVTKIETEEVEPMSVSQHELHLSCSKTIDDIESDDDSCEPTEDDIIGLKDIYITQNLHDQIDMEHPYDKKPVCEYYRLKGRCFKGSKCMDRHVMHSDSEDDDDDDNEFNWIKSVSYMNKSFERHLRIGSTIGMRVSSIYTAGVFYAYLTHGINGFDLDSSALNHTDDDDDGMSEASINDGLDFESIQDMEDSLNDFMKYQFSSFNKDVELLPNTLVAVSFEDKIRRGSITSLISFNRYQVFLIDFGISVEVNLDNLFLLPKKYCSVFKQQCFMCKLYGVKITNESESEIFAEWFFKKVNKQILHAKVIDIFDDGLNLVELYDFINDSSSCSLNTLAKKELKL